MSPPKLKPCPSCKALKAQIAARVNEILARAEQAEAERDALIRKFSVVLPPVDRGVSNLKEEKTT